MEKKSIFNHYIESTDKKYYLFYNALKGSKSLYKIEKNSKLSELLCDQNSNIDLKEKVSKSLYEKLMDLGYYIDYSIDEESYLKYKYVNSIKDGVLGLTIFLTNDCNFRCLYCGQEHNPEYISSVVEEAIVDFVKKNIVNYQSLYITWFGGEPLLAIDKIEHLSQAFQEICSFYKKGFIAEISTNGYLLTPDVFDKLLKYHVRYYTITIDGVREMHDLQRPLKNGGKTFSTIMDNLANIRQRCRRSFVITIRTNLTKKIYDSLDDYLNILDTYICRDSRFSYQFSPIFDWGGGYSKKQASDMVEYSHCLNAYKKLIDKGILKNRSWFRSFLDSGGMVCSGGKLGKYAIFTDGTIGKCAQSYDKKVLSIGSINSEGKFYIDKLKESKWLSEFHLCDKICFNKLSCLFDACPLGRILDIDENDLNCEKKIALNIDQYLLLLEEDAPILEGQ